MFADNTLTPKEAVRLCALGTIARQPMLYSDLAGAVRHFISGVAGPQLELMGTSIELLRYEGLVEAVNGAGMEDDALLALTDTGRREFVALMGARVRPGSDLTKLIIALKMRFLPLLDPTGRRTLTESLAAGVETELARLIDLRGACTDDDEVALAAWLDNEIAILESRLGWLERFSANL